MKLMTIPTLVLASIAPMPTAAEREPIIAGVNIPPPPHNREGEFFFNSSNAVSFSDAYFDYTGFAAEKLDELFDGSPGRGKFRFVSARIQMNAKTALKRWYLDEVQAGPTGELFVQEQIEHSDENAFASLRAAAFTNADVLRARGVPPYLVDSESGRRYVTPLQSVEYVLSYTNYSSDSSPVARPRRAIFNFCGTCTSCTDDLIPPPNVDSHGSGTVDNCDTYVAAWKNIADYFSAARFAQDELHFELFNEPHAGNIRDATFRGCLLRAADAIENADAFSSSGSSQAAGRIIWPASGWEANAAEVHDFSQTETGKELRDFDIGWHFYPFWCSDDGTDSAGRADGAVAVAEGPKRPNGGSGCSVIQFRSMILSNSSLPARSDISAKTWLTEFGGDLYGEGVDYFNPEGSCSKSSTDANFMRALADVAGETYAGGCAQLRGLFLWHGGYFFDDSYTVNRDRKGQADDGVAFVVALAAGLTSGKCAGCTDYDGACSSSEACEQCRLAEPMASHSVSPAEEAAVLI